MVWGSFHARGVGPLKRVEGTLNGDGYHGILTHHAVPKVRELANEYPSDETFYLQQDNTPVHTTNKNKQYTANMKRDKDPEIELLAWPSQSPDLNPIENLWRYVKKQLRKIRPRPTNMEQLWERVQAEWAALPVTLLTSLARSMPNRIQENIAARGGSTSY
jgi:hypothetical protein